jgi:hypothetical protein
MRRAIGIVTLLGALCLTLAWGGVSAQQSGGGRYAAADLITKEELQRYDYFLAADQLEGRNVPSRGYDTAALYVASHFDEWGLRPGGSTTGTSGPLQPYFMPIELQATQIDAPNMKLVVTLPAVSGRGGRGGAGAAGGGRGAAAPSGPPVPRTFEYGKDWTVGGGGGFGRGGGATAQADVTNAPLVFVGNGYVINKTNVNPYQGIDVKGKIVVVAGQPAELAAAAAAAAAGRGAAGGGRGRGAAVNPLGTENVDFTTPQTYAAKNGAVGIITIPTFQQLTAMTNPAGAGGGRGGGLNGPSYQVVRFQTTRPPSVPSITAGIDLTNAIFQGERMTGAQVFEGAIANAKFDSFDLNADKKVNLKVAVTVDHNYTENVVGILEGSDPLLKKEYVVFSGHLDHIGLAAPDASGDGINNGADDDGSGSAAVMAMAHAYAQAAAKGIRPKRTMIFMTVAGEEKGLWGSQYFNQFPPIDIAKVVVDLNMDMIGRTKTPGYVDPPQYRLIEKGEVFVVGPMISSLDLKKLIDTVNSGYQKLKVNDFYDTVAPDATHDNLGPQPNGQRIFYRSDHYNFAKNGIPIAFFCDGLHSDYHRVTDSPEKIDFDNMLKITRTVAAVGWVVANTATPPKLNAKLPDQLVNDMKTAKEAGWGQLTPVLPPLPKMPF